MLDTIIEKLLSLAAANPIGLLVLGVFGSVVVLATVIIAVTPSKSDDAWLAKMKAHKYVGPLVKALEKFSLIKK